MPVISYIQARELLKAVEEKQGKARVLLDLGLTPATFDINYKFREVKTGAIKITFAELDEIASNGTICYFLEKSKSPQKLKLFSADTNRFYKLGPSTDAPPLEISGIRMHRTLGRTPGQGA